MTIDFRSMFQTWVQVLIKPGADVFEAERLKPSATLTTALVWTVLAGVVTTLLQLLHAQLYPSPSWSMWPLPGLSSPEFQAAMEEIPHRSPVQILTGIFTAPALFLISVGIQHLIASRLEIYRIRLEPSGEKRTGKFGRYAYLNATFGAPFSIIFSLLSFVPVLDCITLPLLAIYQFVLTYFATRVEYGLSRGRAIVVVFAAALFVGVGTGILGGALYSMGLSF